MAGDRPERTQDGAPSTRTSLACGGSSDPGRRWGETAIVCGNRMLGDAIGSVLTMRAGLARMKQVRAERREGIGAEDQRGTHLQGVRSVRSVRTALGVGADDIDAPPRTAYGNCIAPS